MPMELPRLNTPRDECSEQAAECRVGRAEGPRFDETAGSSLCYTSGTTGNPKGVVYSHRSTLLHAMMLCMTDGVGISASDMLGMASPMFHVNAWGIPYACTMAGASMVLPGPALDGASIYRAMKAERVTVALGVPTVWMAFQQQVAAEGLDPRQDLCLNRVMIGGAAAPRAVIETFERKFGTRVIHAWGMTETSPVATVCAPLRKHAGATLTDRLSLQVKVPKWWLPDDVVFVEELPHTATGKLQKVKLREMFAGHRSSEA